MTNALRCNANAVVGQHTWAYLKGQGLEQA